MPSENNTLSADVTETDGDVNGTALVGYNPTGGLGATLDDLFAAETEKPAKNKRVVKAKPAGKAIETAAKGKAKGTDTVKLDDDTAMAKPGAARYRMQPYPTAGRRMFSYTNAVFTLLGAFSKAKDGAYKAFRQSDIAFYNSGSIRVLTHHAGHGRVEDIKGTDQWRLTAIGADYFAKRTKGLVPGQAIYPHEVSALVKSLKTGGPIGPECPNYGASETPVKG
jgi:hypothetical protein